MPIKLPVLLGGQSGVSLRFTGFNFPAKNHNFAYGIFFPSTGNVYILLYLYPMVAYPFSLNIYIEDTAFSVSLFVYNAFIFIS